METYNFNLDEVIEGAKRTLKRCEEIFGYSLDLDEKSVVVEHGLGCGDLEAIAAHSLITRKIHVHPAGMASFAEGAYKNMDPPSLRFFKGVNFVEFCATNVLVHEGIHSVSKLREMEDNERSIYDRVLKKMMGGSEKEEDLNRVLSLKKYSSGLNIFVKNNGDYEGFGEEADELFVHWLQSELIGREYFGRGLFPSINAGFVGAVAVCPGLEQDSLKAIRDLHKSDKGVLSNFIRDYFEGKLSRVVIEGTFGLNEIAEGVEMVANHWMNRPEVVTKFLDIYKGSIKSEI